MKHVFAFLGVRFDNKSAGVQKDEKGMVGCLESHSDKLEIHSLYLNHKLPKVMKNIERPENAELYQDDAYLMVRIFDFYFVFCILYFLFLWLFVTILKSWRVPHFYLWFDVRANVVFPVSHGSVSG